MTQERMAQLDELMDEETTAPETQEWRDDLTFEEADYVDACDQSYMDGISRICGGILTLEQKQTQSC
ncbi:MAG: hypothetical protein RR295_10810 [Oscillospiraceae bacterium]